jgi:uncharacterized protein YbjT (DUF2867 family)
MAKKRILVVGASGYVGQHIVPMLLASQYEVWATGRQIAILKQRPWPQNHPNLHLCSLHLNQDPQEKLNELVKNKDIVLFLVHGMSHGDDFVDYELTAALRFQEALQQSHVQQIIYLGALQPTADTDLSPHLYARQQTGEILRQSAIPTVELRAGIIVGAGSVAFEVMCDFVNHLPILLVPKTVKNRNAPIALPNLLHYLKALVDDPINQHRIWDVSGSENISYAEQLRVLSRQLNKKNTVVTLPFLPLATVTPFLIGLTSVPQDIAKALISGLSHDFTPDATEIQHQFPQRLLSYSESVDLALNAQTQLPNKTQWGWNEDALERWERGFGYYPKKLTITQNTSASAAFLWDTINQFGKPKTHHFYGEILWKIRYAVDRLFGGEKQLTNNYHTPFQLGDKLDGWKIIKAEPHRQLGLLFTLKAPGLGRLVFDITDHHTHRTLSITAWWHPKGWLGLSYWFAFYPAHLFLFKGMVNAILKRGKQA